MNNKTIMTVRAALLAACIAVAGFAAPASAETAGTAGNAVLAYKPPMRGAPTNRVGGASRGVGGGIPLLAALSPDHTGLTSSAQPTLYWTLSQPVSSGFVEFSLSEEGAVKPLVEQRLKLDDRSGLMAVSLADYRINLKPDTEYLWNIAYVTDPDQRSHDVVATAAIRRVAAPAELSQKSGKTDKAELPALYAGAGLWYDALDSASRAMREMPGDPRPKTYFSELLRQVGLTEFGTVPLASNALPGR